MEALHAPLITSAHRSQPGRTPCSWLKVHGRECALQTPCCASPCDQHDWVPMPADQGSTSQAELGSHGKAPTNLHVQAGWPCSQIVWLQACPLATT